MKKKIAPLVVALMFLSALTVDSAQTPRGPQIGKHGNLEGLKDGYGKDVLGQISRPWREGYAIAYRVKNPNGVPEDRFVYVIGDQLTKEKLRIKGQKATTLDKVLEISRTFAWDEGSRTLKSDMTVTNISKSAVTVTALEIQLDARFLAPLLGERQAVELRRLFNPLALCVIIGAGADCNPRADCPPCPCGERCIPPQAMAFLREPNNSMPAFKDDQIGPKLPHLDGAMLGLSWTAGSNLAHPTPRPGEQIHVHYQIVIPKK